MVDVSDRELIDRFRATEDVFHFNELVTRHIGKVRALISPMVFNSADADDLTQEVFLKVIDNLHGFNQKAQFSTWLYRIAVNTCYDFLRKRKKDLLACRKNMPDIPDYAAGPADLIFNRELDSRIEEAMESLSPSLRSAIVLTALHGMSVREAANLEKCLVATMYWRVHQARKLLGRKLGVHPGQAGSRAGAGRENAI